MSDSNPNDDNLQVYNLNSSETTPDAHHPLPPVQPSLLQSVNHALLSDILSAYPHEFSEADVCIVSLTDMTTMVLMLFGPRSSEGEAISLKFRAAWQEVSRLTPKALNTFNSKFRYVKAFFDDDQDPVIEMDVLVTGTSKQFLQATLRKFAESVSAFEAFLTLADSFVLQDGA